MAASPICLNWSIHLTIFSKTSRMMTISPFLFLYCHLFFKQRFFFSSVAMSTPSSTANLSGILSSMARRSSSLRVRMASCQGFSGRDSTLWIGEWFGCEDEGLAKDVAIIFFSIQVVGSKAKQLQGKRRAAAGVFIDHCEEVSGGPVWGRGREVQLTSHTAW